MSDAPRKILVTSALPYANGSIHMGHLVEYIQTDIWVRFQKLRGHDCTYVCASDAHGTPIMIKARELGVTPEELTTRVSKEFVRDFADVRRRIRQLPHDALAGKRGPDRRDVRGAARCGRHLHQDDRTGLRRAGRHVPARPLRARHLPALQSTGPVRRRLRKLRRDVHASGPHRPGLRTVRHRHR